MTGSYVVTFWSLLVLIGGGCGLIRQVVVCDTLLNACVHNQNKWDQPKAVVLIWWLSFVRGHYTNLDWSKQFCNNGALSHKLRNPPLCGCFITVYTFFLPEHMYYKHQLHRLQPRGWMANQCVMGNIFTDFGLKYFGSSRCVIRQVNICVSCFLFFLVFYTLCGILKLRS